MVSNTPDLHIAVVDEDSRSRELILSILADSLNSTLEGFACAETFKREFRANGKPTCVLMDIKVGSVNAMKYLKSMARDGLDHPVIMMAEEHSVPLVVEAMRSGASDFLAKPICANDLLDAVQAAIKSGRHQPGKSSMDSMGTDLTELASNLAPREQETLEQLLKGDSEKQIAFKLSISPHTVHSYVKSIYKQFDVCSRAELLAKCLNS